MNPNYSRVIPRDLFNEAKLLKCMGILALWELDNVVFGIKITCESETTEFQVALSDEGALSIVNYHVLLFDQFHEFKTVYNSKRPHPLYITNKEGEDIWVIDDDGKPSKEFLDYINSLKTDQ